MTKRPHSSFLIPHPHSSSNLHRLCCLHSPPFATRIITPHPKIGSISKQHQSQLQLSPSSQTIIHLFTTIIPTHDHHSYFWLASHLDISATSSSPPTHHLSSTASLQLLPSSQISNSPHRLSSLCNSVSFSTSIYTCNSITPASFSAESLTASTLTPALLSFSLHHLSLIHACDQLSPSLHITSKDIAAACITV